MSSNRPVVSRLAEPGDDGYHTIGQMLARQDRALARILDTSQTREGEYRAGQRPLSEVVRGDRGESALSAIVGMALAAIIIGGFGSFWVTADRAEAHSSQVTAARADVSTATQCIGRDLADADRLVALAPQDVIVADGGGGTAERLVRWTVVGGDLVRQSVMLPTGAAHDPAVWDGVVAQPVAHDVDPEKVLFADSGVGQVIDVHVATVTDGVRAEIETAAAVGGFA